MKTPEDTLDQLLVLQCQHGDEAALAKLVERWQPILARHALRLTGKPDVIADIVQEAWLAIVRGLHKLDDPARFRPWAYRIVTNKCSDWIRRQQLERDAQTQLISASNSNRPISEELNQIALLQQALKQLPHEKRALLTMFYLDEMSVPEIALAMGLPSGTVKSRLFHARKQLRIKIERNTHE